MTIKYDEKDVTVYICDEHAEDATLKHIRAAYAEQRKKIEEFMKTAEAMGYKLVPANEGGAITRVESANPPAAPAPAKPVQPQQQTPVDGKVQRVRDPQIKIADQRATPFAGKQASYNLGNIKTEDGKQRANIVKEQQEDEVISGRGGVPTQIPKRIKDSTGTTTVRISKGITDRDLIERTKARADTPHLVSAEGYMVDDCHMCRGSGQAINGQACPKCGGHGVVNR